jgi:glucokinase
MILASDIGGTKTNLGYFEVRESQLVSVVEATYGSTDYPGLEEIVVDFLGKHRVRPQRVCIGVAGPVKDGHCEGVNLPWVVDAKTLSARIGVSDVDVVNDLEATAYSLNALSPEDIVPLHAVAGELQGNAAVIAAGTGLGEAGLYWDGKHHWPFAGEGGHTDFGVRDAVEADLLEFLLQKYEHVSIERVLSGPGFVDLYDFFRHREPDAVRETIDVQHEDAAALISQAALDQRCPVCEKTLDRFVSIYGAEAGNLALTVLATGGVYVGGGIAPKIIEKLTQPAFLEAFFAKGRMRSFMQSIPVSVIMTNRAALIGAAEYARLQAC